MTKTKKQLRAEAVERLQNHDDDSIIQEVESTIELLSDGTDSREKLEADVLKYYTHTVSTAMWPPSANKHTDMVSVSMDMVLEWLDRQAAITEHEWEIEQAYINGGYKEQIAELNTERDLYREKLSRALDLAHEIERLMP